MKDLQREVPVRDLKPIILTVVMIDLIWFYVMNFLRRARAVPPFEGLWFWPRVGALPFDLEPLGQYSNMRALSDRQSWSQPRALPLHHSYVIILKPNIFLVHPDLWPAPYCQSKTQSVTLPGQCNWHCISIQLTLHFYTFRLPVYIIEVHSEFMIYKNCIYRMTKLSILPSSIYSQSEKTQT